MTGIVTADVLLCVDALVCESPVPFLSLLICKLSSGAPTGQAPPCFCSQSTRAWLHSLIRTLVTFGQARARNTAPPPARQGLMSLSCTLYLKKLCCMMGNSSLRLWGPSAITDLKATVSLCARIPSPRKEGH